MTENIAVVKPHYTLEEAYQMGHDEFSELDLGPDAEPDLAGFQDSARYANHILPKLRAMAGFEDSGHGTFQKDRKVAAIEPGNEEDRPAEAELVDASTVFHALVDAWSTGARDGMTGTFDPASILNW